MVVPRGRGLVSKSVSWPFLFFMSSDNLSTGCICVYIYIYIYIYMYIYIFLNFYSRLRSTRSFVLSGAARALHTEAPILDPVFSFFLTCSLGSHFVQKSRQISKTAVPGHHVQGWRKWFEKTCDFGLLKTSQTKTACGREHDFRVLTLSRKSSILGLFWTFILERLWISCAENKVSMGVWKLLDFWIDL